MIGYVTLGTNDLPRAAEFYDALLAEFGAQRFMEEENFIAWACGPDKPGIGLTRPWNGEPASVGNGVMVALEADSPDMVDRVHQKALDLGGSDEGPAGFREGLEGFYAGYFRDPDGNKLNVFCFMSSE